MPYPDTYRERHAALQRAVRIVYEHRTDRAEIGVVLADDVDALVELFDTLGIGDEFMAEVQRAAERQRA
jgi:hypothetical protein